MKTLKILLGASLMALVAALGVLAQEPSPTPYDQKIDVVYGEVHGTGLLMDIFTPKGKANGLAIIDVASGAFYSDRGKIRDHTMAQFYTIFCSRGYTVFAIRPGSRSRYTESGFALTDGVRFMKAGWGASGAQSSETRSALVG